MAIVQTNKVWPPESFRKEIGLIIALPVLLGVIHYALSGSAKQALAFSHDQFAIHTLFTAAYVHAGQGHLLNNVVGYLLATLYTYMLCVAAEERRWFWRTFVLFLLALPWSLLHSSSPGSRCRSGVTSGKQILTSAN